MKQQLTIEAKQEVLLSLLRSKPDDYAVFGVEREVVIPLIKQRLIHKDTYRYTGGCAITKAGRMK